MCTTNPYLTEVLKKMGITEDELAKLIKAEPSKESSNEADWNTEMVAMSQTMKKVRLASKIESGMKAKGLTRKAFAVLMNVQPSIITRWLSGAHNFTVETLYTIEEKLNITIITK